MKGESAITSGAIVVLVGAIGLGGRARRLKRHARRSNAATGGETAAPAIRSDEKGESATRRERTASEETKRQNPFVFA